MHKHVDLSLKVVIVSILLTLVLAISNTYLALKVGLLTAASIPAAILSMGIMKAFRSSTIYEHNLVQTTASSGEAIAGGIGYTIPALIVMGFWHEFHYWENVLIALTGGVIGVLFSSLIRRPLLEDNTLRFPEGQAISEVLKLKEKSTLGFKEMLISGGLAAVLEFAQNTGLMFAGGVKYVLKFSSIFVLGGGISPALIGAGYIVGARVGFSLLLGIILSYLVILPGLSHHLIPMGVSAQAFFSSDLAMNMRYVGVGAMLAAALLTLLGLLRPLYQNLKQTLGALQHTQPLARHEQDLPKKAIIAGLLLTIGVLIPLLNHLFQLPALGLHAGINALGIGLSIGFILIIGFIIAIVCGYFSGLVGVSASPGSSVMIAGLILAALLIHSLFALCGLGASPHEMMLGEAMTIIIASIVMQIACISNDTLQDLKVGQLIGASPKNQEIMLIFGVILASLTVPFVMQILYQAYGVGGVMPRLGMDPNLSLAAPPAAMMAALTGAIFQGAIPGKMLLIGAVTIVILSLFQRVIGKRLGITLSFIGVGIGMYLPLMSSTPLILGALLSFIIAKRCKNEPVTLQRKMLVACGLVTGATLMDVCLALPVALHPSGAGLSFSVSTPVIVILTIVGGLGFMRLVLSQTGRNRQNP